MIYRVGAQYRPYREPEEEEAERRHAKNRAFNRIQSMALRVHDLRQESFPNAHSSVLVRAPRLSDLIFWPFVFWKRQLNFKSDVCHSQKCAVGDGSGKKRQRKFHDTSTFVPIMSSIHYIYYFFR